MVFRKFFGMIISVSILTIGIGAATPRSVVNFSIFSLVDAGINGLSAGPSSRRDWSAARLGRRTDRRPMRRGLPGRLVALGDRAGLLQGGDDLRPGHQDRRLGGLDGAACSD